MSISTAGLTLAQDAAIDLQLHTVYSDGAWTPEALIDHLISAGFALAAITDHDRVDTAAALQTLALQRGLPLLVAAEFTTDWRGDMTDVLCFGFDPQHAALQALCADLLQRQQENTRTAFASLVRSGVPLPSDALDSLLALPSARQPQELLTLVHRTGTPDALQRVIDAGSDFARTPIASVVATAHQSGAVVLIAHPGRGDLYVPFTVERLDQLRAEVPIDGFEVYYPLHTPEQVAMFHAYAEQHNLLVSAGSDSHAPEKRTPIRYPASHARRLLERLGITVR